MNKSKILYISDLDGTLLNNKAELTDFSRNELNKLIDGGLNFTVATARTSFSTEVVLKGLNLNIPVILMNGVILYDFAKKEYLKVNYMEPYVVNSVISAVKESKINCFVYEIKDGVFSTYYENLEKKQHFDFYNERVMRFGKLFIKTDSFYSLSNSNKIYFAFLDTYEILKSIEDKIKKIPEINYVFYKDTYSKDFWYLEIFHKNASKKNAANYLKQKYGFDRLIGFGDNINDMPLFEACDESYAVENARAELKNIATGIIKSNEENGVVEFLLNL